MRRSTTRKLLYPEAARRLIDDYHFSIAQVAHAYETSAIMVSRYLRAGRHNYQQSSKTL